MGEEAAVDGGDNGLDSRVTNFAFVGNGIEMLAQLGRVADQHGAKLVFDVMRQRLRREKQAHAVAPEGVEHGVVFEFAGDLGPYLVLHQPGVDASAQRIVAGGY